MKKLIFTVIITLFFMNDVYPQTDIGITFSPLISANRISSESDTLSFSNSGIGARFKLGILVDIPLSEFYALSTGFLFVPQRVALQADNGVDRRSYKEIYKLQYLNIPATVKLFTNEVALDTRLYFQAGGVAEILINDKPKNESNFLIRKFRGLDLSALIGMGLEYSLGLNTRLFGGVSYQRGLTNVASDTAPIDKRLSVKNDLIALDLGIKF